MASGQEDEASPTLTKLDSTRDLGGTLYAQGDYRNKHRELAQALELEFGCPFRDNGNSFASCLQFEGQPEGGQLHMRVKYYCKSLALFQSESVS